MRDWGSWNSHLSPALRVLPAHGPQIRIWTISHDSLLALLHPSSDPGHSLRALSVGVFCLTKWHCVVSAQTHPTKWIATIRSFQPTVKPLAPDTAARATNFLWLSTSCVSHSIRQLSLGTMSLLLPDHSYHPLSLSLSLSLFLFLFLFLPSLLQVLLPYLLHMLWLPGGTSDQVAKQVYLSNIFFFDFVHPPPPPPPPLSLFFTFSLYTCCLNRATRVILPFHGPKSGSPLYFFSFTRCDVPHLPRHTLTERERKKNNELSLCPSLTLLIHWSSLFKRVPTMCVYNSEPV